MIEDAAGMDKRSRTSQCHTWTKYNFQNYGEGGYASPLAFQIHVLQCKCSAIEHCGKNVRDPRIHVYLWVEKDMYKMMAFKISVWQSATYVYFTAKLEFKPRT